MADGDSEADIEAEPFTTIANGDASNVLVVVAITVVDEPAASGVSWNGGPVTADGDALAASLPLGAPLPPVSMLAPGLEAPLLSLGDIDAGAPLDADPPDSGPLAPGEPDAPLIRSAQDPCCSTADIPSDAPVEIVIWTCVVPSG